MRNLVQDGLVVPLTAPVDTLPGDLVNVGAIVGVAVGAAPAGAVVQTRLEGVFDGLPGTTGAAGAVVYFNSTDKNLTTTASGNTRVGVSLGNGRVRLNGSF